MKEKLAALRTEMKKCGIDGFFVPRADEFQGEYVPACAERLSWITNFSGSAGSAVILKDKAGFFTDGRYTIQARDEVDDTLFNICSVSEGQAPIPTTQPTEWIIQNLQKGAVFGIHAWVHTPHSIKKIREAVERAGATLKRLDDNPLDAAWTDRPAVPATPTVPHPLNFAGKESLEKRQDMAKILKDKNVHALAITLPEEVCWLLNVRGTDVPRTPFTLSYAILHDNAQVDWFIDAVKLSDDTRAWVGDDVRIHPLEDFSAHIKALAKDQKEIWLDPATSPVKLLSIIAAQNGETYTRASPIQMAKAIKNNTEVTGTTNAHIRDGVAVTRFLAALSEQGGAAKYNEVTAEILLENFRKEEEHFKQPSFDTISGAGGNGAIVHYRAHKETCSPLLAGPVYLVDSGGQYLDGTTDITRTIAVDNVTEEMKDRFTRVLKGHIQVAMAIFPEGTTGDVLDVKARAPLKEIGLDYAHGTGHGVGSYLSVHEGPCGISSHAKTVHILPGMVISNEPGFYKEGEYGIRIENLVTVIDTGKIDIEGKRLFAFKTLTQAPIDKNLIETSLLTAEELQWLNDYHAHVRKTLLPLLKDKDPKAAAFLESSTTKI